jgi:adenylate kinase family enzyme
MGSRNFLIEGGSGTGKTSVCEELARRGYHVVHGDRELAYQGDPETGAPMADVIGVAVQDHHLWRVDKVEALVADQREAVTLFCGGSRNFAKFVDLRRKTLSSRVSPPRPAAHSRVSGNQCWRERQSVTAK